MTRGDNGGAGEEGRGSRGRAHLPDLGEQLGVDYDPSVFTRGREKFVSQSLAWWALSVSVETDRDTYDVGEPVELRITISNRLPLPVTLTIEGKRVWGWEIDGIVEATDEPLYLPDTRRTLSLRAGETRIFTRVWEGLIKRYGHPTTWEEPPPGEHEITAFVATEPRTSGSTTVRPTAG